MSESSLNTSISKSRTFLMGVAMVSVILFHQGFVYQGAVPRFFHTFGNLGVDVFIFLSGFGIYHSLKKDESNSLIDFYKRRFYRIIPTSIIGGIMFLYFWCGSGIYNLYGLNFYSAFVGLDVWYIRTILIYYLASPFLFRFVVKYNKYSLMGLFIIYLLVISITPYINDYLDNCFHSLYINQTVCWTIMRFPAYFLGIIVANANYRKLSFFRASTLSLAILCCSVYALVRTGYAANLISDEIILSIISKIGSVAILLPAIPYASIAADWLCDKIWLPFKKCICWCGLYSLELFLSHSAIFPYTRKIFGTGYIEPLAAVICSVLAAILLKKISSRVVKAIRAE